MDTSVPTILPDMTVSELCDRISQGDPRLTPRQATPIVDAEGHLAGLITRGDLVRALAKGEPDSMTVLEAGSRDPIVAFPDERVRDAVERMLQNNIGRLMVVDRKNKNEFLGYLGRSKVMQSWLGSIDEEMLRESFITRRRGGRGE